MARSSIAGSSSTCSPRPTPARRPRPPSRRPSRSSSRSMGRAVEVSRAHALEARDYRPLRFGRLREFVERESVFSWLILTPPILFLLLFLGYPFFYGVYLSFFRREVTGPATFVGARQLRHARERSDLLAVGRQHGQVHRRRDHPE